MTANQPILQLKGIGKSFSGVKVLDDIELDLFPGEVHCLVGENGAGKSTLIKIISGAYQADSGSFYLSGEEITDVTPANMLNRGVTTIYQEIDVIPVLTVSENISLGQEPLSKTGSIDRDKMDRIALESLKQIGAEHIDIHLPMGKLKVAHQQMAVIAKALHHHSKIIIFDEPSAVFSAREVDLLYRIVRGLKEKGIAIIYISHHFDEIFAIGDRVTVLKDGRLSARGMLRDYTHDSLITAMVGRDIDLSYRDSAVVSGNVALKIQNFSLPGVFKEINLEVHQGEIVGIAGLVGSGRTELLQAILGIEKGATGKITLNGKAIKISSPKEALQKKIGILPENRKDEGLVLMRSVEENGAISSIVTESRFGIPPWKKIKQRVHEILSSLSVKFSHIHTEIRFLSGGNQQKVVFAKLLAAGCDILVLDEPTRGVDVGARTEIYQEMQNLRRQRKAILMVSSDLTEILSQSDRIMVMAKGCLAGELSHSEATEEKILALALSTPGGIK